MAIWIFDQQYRLDSGPPVHPLYYWSNSWSWWQADATAPDNDVLTTLVQGARYLVPQQTTHTIWRVTAPDGSYVWPLSGIEDSGLAPFTDAPGPLGQCVLVDFWSGGRRVGYKRLRGPWSVSLVEGANWSTTLTDWLRDYGLPNMTSAPLCSRRGVLFDSFTVRPQIHIWQIRHGSKRAARPLFVLP